MYINSSLAKAEALKSGYDESGAAFPARLRERVHRGKTFLSSATTAL